MSFDEYALSLAQKYRLAISMAVLRTKPEHLTINEYINEIRDVINDRHNDTLQQDLDMTACSDDFNIDDDDDDIMKIDLSQVFMCDQVVKSVKTDAHNDRNSSNNYKIQHNERQIDNNYRIDDKLTIDSQSNDKAITIQLNEDVIESIAIGTHVNYSKRQITDNINQHTGNRTEDKGDNDQMDDNVLYSSEKCHQIDSRTKFKGMEVCGEDTLCITQGLNSMEEGAHRIQEYENKTQVTDTTKKSDPNRERRDKFREVIKILKGVNVPTEKIVKEKDITSPAIGKIKSFDPTDLDLTQCYDDSDDTFLHMDRLADVGCQSINDKQPENQYITNYDTMEVYNSVTSNEPSEIITSTCSKDSQEVRKRKTDLGVEKNAISEAKLLKTSETNDMKTATVYPLNSISNNNLHYAMGNGKKAYRDRNDVNFSVKSTILNHATLNNMEIENKTVQHEQIPSVRLINTQDTQFNTYYSESQKCDIVIDRNLIYGNKNQNVVIAAKGNKLIDKNSENTNKENRENTKICIFSHKTKELQKSQNVTRNTHNDEYTLEKYQDAFLTQEFNTNINECTENVVALSFDANDRINIDNNREITIDILQNDRKTVKDIDKNSGTKTQMYQIHTERDIIEDNRTLTQRLNPIENSLVTHDNEEVINENNKEDTICTENEMDCTDFDKINEINDEEITEKVPFKILEEMNQIKSYLSKKREFKDSGYKSSQSQRSGICSQSSTVRVGESADSVFVYLSTCPLDVATQELTEQLSEVLGQIIDRLHEEEIYPKFLEELLNTVEKLLRLVYEEENYDFDVLQKKDEQIQRIILLNKSSHINKYTIEKINDILQKLPEEISDTEYEIREINKLENLCYIFHILQIILPRYIQGKLYNSQVIQPSQEQKVLKKQDISEIWRRKWFTNAKENENEGSLESKCVLKECSAILNKIIVDFMDGYSLIAFSALKCFNLIQ